MMVTDEEWENFKASLASATENGDYWPAIMVLLILSAGMSLSEKEDRPG